MTLMTHYMEPDCTASDCKSHSAYGDWCEYGEYVPDVGSDGRCEGYCRKVKKG